VETITKSKRYSFIRKKKNPDKINWAMLSRHLSIFEFDYKTMKKQMVDIYFEELMMVALHPRRISAWLDAGFEDF
jgi:hypothetical protein